MIPISLVPSSLGDEIFHHSYNREQTYAQFHLADVETPEDKALLQIKRSVLSCSQHSSNAKMSRSCVLFISFPWHAPVSQVSSLKFVFDFLEWCDHTQYITELARHG